MKSLVLVVLILLVSVVRAQASTFEWEQGTEETTFLKLFVQKPITENEGLFVFGQTAKDWGQAYIGPYHTDENYEIGIGYGVETYGRGKRWGGYLAVWKDRFSGCYILEGGSSGKVYQTTLLYSATPKVKVGHVKDDFFGEALRVEVQLAEDLKLGISAFPNKTLVGIQTSY